MTSKIIRCAIYTRKSSEEGLEQDFNSLHAQREASEAFIKSQQHEGWQMLKTLYDDGGYSGGTMERPALKQLMADIMAGKIDVVVVYKVDRLSRSLHDFAKMVEVFDKHNVSFVSVTQQFNTTSSMGRLTLNVLLSFAQFEREVTGERIRDKIAASKKKGMWMGGYVPLGYVVDNRKLVSSSSEAATVKHIYERYLEVGSVRELAEELNTKGIHSKARDNITRPGGKAFSRGALYHLLSNPLYRGLIQHKGISHPGQHEAIIEQELWEKVQQQLAANRAGVIAQYHRTDKNSLHGKLFDAATREPLVVVHANKKGRRYRYYISESLRTAARAEGKRGWRLQGNALEQAVNGAVQSMLNDHDAIIDALKLTQIPSHAIPQVLANAKNASQAIAEICSVFLKQAYLYQDGIELTLSLASLIPDTIANDSSITITQKTPMRIQRRGHEMRLVIEGSEQQGSNLDKTLIKSIARAHQWAEELLTGKSMSMTEIALRHQVSDSYVKKIMPLAFLAPDIIEAILSGKQPAHITTQMLIRQVGLPIDWNEQHQMLGFTV